MASNRNPYGNLDDAFETYIDMDFLRNDKLMEDETNNNNSMSTSDLFQYFFEGEEGANEAPSYQTPPHIPEGYGLISNAIMGGGDPVKLANPVQTIDSINLLTQQSQSQHSQPITSTTVETSVSILNAQLAELLSKFQIKQNVPDNKLSNTTTPSDNDISAAKSISQHTTPTTPKSSKGTSSDNQIQIDDDSQLDIKKLSSKERRQIQYIQNLESIKNQQEEEINILKQALLHLQEENTQLKQEVEELRKLNQPNKSHMTSPPSPPHNPATLASPFNTNNSNGSLQMIKGSSSTLFTNTHQPASPTSQTTSPNIWQDSRVRVQTTFIPEFNFDKYLFEEKLDFSYSNLYDGYPNFWFAYVLVSTFLQQITSLFLEAVVTTPKQQMIPALFRHPVVLPELFPLLKEDDNKLLYVNVSDNYDDNIQLLNNNIVVESIKEASVLDWLYDSMLQQVVEQSQIEARIMELSSDWVGDDLDDNVLPLLF
ncbi:5269_t:CDS:2 [Entrophospora sp. SA101]|nr:5269_t:CDS:2 [Entrophospora sp. SA101]